MTEPEPDALSQLASSIQKQGRICDLDLQDAKLAASDLSGLLADRINLRGADLRGTQLAQVRLGACRLEAAKLEAADLAGATLRACTLNGARGVGARFDNARIEDCSIKGADLTRASLRGARLTETSFTRTVLREAALDDAKGDGVEFRGADLSGATLCGAQLDEADFRGADLTGADLSTGRFRSADFRGALLDGTSFDGADCSDAYFDEGCGPNARGASASANDEDTSPLDRATIRLLTDLIARLPEFATAREAVPDVLAELQRTVADLDLSGDQPPEAWKPWLEQLMKVIDGEPSLDEMIDALLSGAEHMSPEDLQTWFGRVAADLTGRKAQPGEQPGSG